MTIKTESATLRETARAAVIAEVENAERKAHERNYERLHVWRDGKVSWFESIDRHSDIIDDQAEGFRAVESVCLVGTGSYSCNCDFCEMIGEENGYPDTAAAVADSISEHGTGDRESDMLAKFDAIEHGYFDDEDEPTEPTEPTDMDTIRAEFAAELGSADMRPGEDEKPFDGGYVNLPDITLPCGVSACYGWWIESEDGELIAKPYSIFEGGCTLTIPAEWMAGDEDGRERLIRDIYNEAIEPELTARNAAAVESFLDHVLRPAVERKLAKLDVSTLDYGELRRIDALLQDIE